MIPLFVVADHVNYVRWGLYYLHSMEALPDNFHSHFLKVELTIQLFATPLSGIWSDMGIEVLYNRISKKAAGIIRQSKYMETVKVWAYSLNAYSEIVECLEAMEGRSSTDNRHKKKKKCRMSHNQIDQDNLISFHWLSLMPLNMGMS